MLYPTLWSCVLFLDTKLDCAGTHQHSQGKGFGFEAGAPQKGRTLEVVVMSTFFSTQPIVGQCKMGK